MKPLPGCNSIALPGVRRVTLVRMAAICSILSGCPGALVAMNSFSSTALKADMAVLCIPAGRR